MDKKNLYLGMAGNVFKTVCAIFLIIFSQPVSSEERNMLGRSISFDSLYSVICFDRSWVDYPAYKDRNAWRERVAPEIGEKIVKSGERALKHKWEPDLASDYLAFKRTGEIRTGRENHKALQALTMAELVEGKGRFIDTIVDGAWFLCETSWIHSAHLGFQSDQSGLPDWNEPTIELVVADIGAQMSWLHYFFKDEFDKISPLIDKRIVEEIQKRFIDPYFERNDYWWMGFSHQQVNNWTPWINYNVLQALMLVEDERDRVRDGVWKLMRSTDFFFNMYHEDGACDEGPTYWSAASGYALKFLDLLKKVTGNKVDIFDEPLIHNMAQYIYRVHIGKNYFVNFADSSPKVYPTPSILFQFGKCIGDEKMKGFAAYIAKQNHSFSKGVNGYFATALDELFMYAEIQQYPPYEPLIRDYWFKDTQICIARDRAKTTEGFFFAAKGGHNQESHNHNDVGSCILYHDNNPILIDAGVGTYTRQTFGSERYSLWMMRSNYHNLPTINGEEQKNGKMFAARDQQYKSNAQSVVYSMDIAGAYSEEANVKKWIRKYTLIRGKRFIIEDEWLLSENRKPIILNLITCCTVETDSENEIYFENENNRFHLKYDKELFSLTTETIKLTDKKLKRSWGDKSLTRIMLKLKDTKLKGHCKMTFEQIY